MACGGLSGRLRSTLAGLIPAQAGLRCKVTTYGRLRERGFCARVRAPRRNSTAVPNRRRQAAL